MRKLIFILSVWFAILAYPTSLPSYYWSEHYSNRIANDGNYLWIASKKGVVRYEKATGKCILLEDSGLDKDTITCIAKDKVGNLWIGTLNNALYKYDGYSYRHYDKVNPINQAHIMRCYSMAFDENGHAWTGGFIWYIDCTASIGYTIPSPPNSNRWEHNAMDMAFDSKGKLWMAIDEETDNYLAYHDKKTAKGKAVLKGTSATSLSIDSKDNIWLTCANGIHYYNSQSEEVTIYSYRDNPDIPKTTYTDCDIDQDGNSWFVSSHYLLKYNGEKFSYYNCYGFDEARSVLCDGSVVWIYTKNDDVIKYENGEFTRKHIEIESTGINNSEKISKGPSITYEKNGSIRIANTCNISKVGIYNAAGTFISSIAINKKEATIEKSVFPNQGLYLIKIYDTERETTVKVIK